MGFRKVNLRLKIYLEFFGRLGYNIIVIRLTEVELTTWSMTKKADRLGILLGLCWSF